MNNLTARYLAKRGIYDNCKRVLDYMINEHQKELVERFDGEERVNADAVGRLFHLVCEELKIKDIDMDDISIYSKFNNYDGFINHLERRPNVVAIDRRES